MTDSPSQDTKDPHVQLKYIITIAPLGMLYGSAGPFLSPENLVGRSGDRFPPNTTTVAGLYGATQWKDTNSLKDLYIVGPFWAKQDAIENFYVPTPLNFRIAYNTYRDQYQVVERWQWNKHKGWHLPSNTKEKKAASNTWVAIEHWNQLRNWPVDNCVPCIPVATTKKVWQYHPHLHPRLEEDQRRVAVQSADSDLPAQSGSLFLENGVQLHPDYCLIYLSSRKIDNGWYRFGGEGHLAEIECREVSQDSALQKLLAQPVGQCFSIVTPAVWGTQRLSYRFPVTSRGQQSQKEIYPIPAHIQSPQETPISSFWNLTALMTDRPVPFRFRLGGEKGKTKRLSRGRYGVPAGTVYQLAEPLQFSWQEWEKDWFPLEGYSYKHWGCGFALPL
jgi:CRISPR-associated protein Cmr3